MTFGGGIYAYYSTVEIDDWTINDSVGGGIVNAYSVIHLKKSVVDGVFFQVHDYA